MRGAARNPPRSAREGYCISRCHGHNDRDGERGDQHEGDGLYERRTSSFHRSNSGSPRMSRTRCITSGRRSRGRASNTFVIANTITPSWVSSSLVTSGGRAGSFVTALPAVEAEDRIVKQKRGGDRAQNGGQETDDKAPAQCRCQHRNEIDRLRSQNPNNDEVFLAFLLPRNRLGSTWEAGAGRAGKRARPAVRYTL